MIILRKLLLGAAFGLLILAGFMIYMESRDGRTSVDDVRIMPEFTLNDLEGRAQSVRQWQGQVMLVNFWATWCPPCRREVPAFVDFYEQYRDKGFVIVGVAIDTPDKVADFAEEHDINYPLLAGEQDGAELSRQFGNHLSALPFSALVDRQGRIVATRRGELKKEELEALVAPYL